MKPELNGKKIAATATVIAALGALAAGVLNRDGKSVNSVSTTIPAVTQVEHGPTVTKPKLDHPNVEPGTIADPGSMIDGHIEPKSTPETTQK